MIDRRDRLQEWITGQEDEHTEFKEAKNDFSFSKLIEYCIAFANEGGGILILGVTDKPPRRVVGTRAFRNLDETRKRLFDKLHCRIDVDEIFHEDGRVLVFHIPPRPIGIPMHVDGRYLMRQGDSLVPMTHDQLQRILAESTPDFTAEICPKAVLTDLDTTAIQRFRGLLIQKSGKERYRQIPDDRLLTDAELVMEGAVTYAALILFGTHQSLGRHLSQSEISFEYRSTETSIRANQRIDFREGFFLYFDRLWDTINQRNDLQHFQNGLIEYDLPTFNKMVVREAILNAVSHREYRDRSSIFIRQYPRKLVVESPGGLPPGITPANIIWEHCPRNRRIAETFQRCGFVERSGQGADLMFTECIREAKSQPSYEGTNERRVVLTLDGEIFEPEFLRYLERIGSETMASFLPEDFIVLDSLRRDLRLSDSRFKDRLPHLAKVGAIERFGRGRGVKYILSRRFYEHLGQPGVYTRKRGLDRETHKELLMKHIQNNRKAGSRLSDLMQVLPTLTRHQIYGLLKELKSDGRVYSTGIKNVSKWYPIQ